jgi:membrane protein YqaA with SNARE-associated domain
MFSTGIPVLGGLAGYKMGDILHQSLTPQRMEDKARSLEDQYSENLDEEREERERLKRLGVTVS